MTIILDVTTELESQIRQAAANAGISTDTFILDSVKKQLHQTNLPASGPKRLSGAESVFIQNINQSLSQIHWARYQELLDKRQSGSLTLEEQDELILFSDQIEAANVMRMEYVAELARVRQTTIPVIMKELGLKPTAYV